MLDVPKAAENVQILLLNDQSTPFDFVVDLLVSVFSKEDVDAHQLAATAHHYGEVLCGLWPPSVAAALLDAANARIKAAGHSLSLAQQSAEGRSVPGQAKCDFCGTPEAQVAKLYGTRAARICNNCILQASAHLSGSIKSAKFRHSKEILDWHFAGTRIEDLVTSTRVYPERSRADLQRALDEIMPAKTVRLVGVKGSFRYEALTFADLLQVQRDAKLLTPVQYADVDVGDDAPVSCIERGLWLLECDGLRHAALISNETRPQGGCEIRLEIAVPAGEAGQELVQRYFAAIETTITAANAYRGKILSLETADHWSGMAGAVLVHRLPAVSRDQVILPEETLALLDRNVLSFAEHRSRLKSLGQSAKKGLLFYGPPGTGKTHTVRYLASCLPKHTTLLVTAEQVGLLPAYFGLARLLQPSLVVIEDADLIARQRETMGSACEESLLNRLLNEMDGLKEDAEIFFILTTNRPEQLEAALSGRPGRIDQAVEFPVPDRRGREKLVGLYGGTLALTPNVVAAAVERTEGVSAAFIKELMRRVAQASFERGDDAAATSEDLDRALGEMLFEGGRLNSRLLGGQQDPQASP
mgnify:CR=1 FL=1